MPASRRVVKTSVNEKGQTVAMDERGSWKVYNPETETFGAYAKGPVIETSESAPPGIDPERVEAAATASSSVQEEIARLASELSICRETRESLVSELALVKAARMRDLADKADAERNFGVRTTELSKKEAELVDALAQVGGADPAEVARLRAEVSSLTQRVNDAVAAQKKAEGERDTGIARLTKERDDARAARPSSTASTFVRTAYTKHRGWAVGATAALALFLFLLLFGSFNYYFSSPNAQVASLQAQLSKSQGETAQALQDKGNAESDLGKARGFQRDAETARDKAAGEAATAKGEAAAEKKLKEEAQAELSKLKAGGAATPAPAPATMPRVQTPAADPPVQRAPYPTVPSTFGERWGSGKDLFKVNGIPSNLHHDGVSDPDKAALCELPRRLYKTNNCRRVSTGQIECKNACY